MSAVQSKESKLEAAKLKELELEMAAMTGALTLTKEERNPISLLSYGMQIAACALLALMTIVGTYDVMGRLLFNHPLKGGYEIVALLFIVMAMLSLPYCEAKNMHIRITFLMDMLPKSAQEISLVVSRIFVVFTFAIMAWRLFILPTGLSNDLLLPMRPFSILAALGAAMLVVAVLANVVQQFIDAEKRWSVVVGIIIAIGMIVLSGFLLKFQGMTAPQTGIFVLVLMIVLVIFGAHIGSMTAMTGFAGIAYIGGVDMAFNQMASIPWFGLNNFIFATIPLFIYMGVIAGESGMATSAYEAARSWMGRITGGLAIASSVATSIFAAPAATTIACVLTLGKIAYPEMDRFGYNRGLAVGTIASAATLGPMIPPSASFIIIGLLYDVSIGQMLIAGIIPGILHALIYVATIYVLCRINPTWGPKGPRTTFKEKVYSLKGVWAIGLLFLFSMGGIYVGWFTATEAGGIGAAGALVITVLMKRFTRKMFTNSLMETMLSVGTIVVLIAGGLIFAKFVILSQIPFVLGDWVTALNMPAFAVILLIVLVFYIWGFFISSQMLLIITIPVVFPLIVQLGYDPIWWAVIMVTVIEMGSIVPPQGIALFAMQASTGLPIKTIYKGILPFVILSFINIALLLAFPKIATWLPSLMMK